MRALKKLEETLISRKKKLGIFLNFEVSWKIPAIPRKVHLICFSQGFEWLKYLEKYGKNKKVFTKIFCLQALKSAFMKNNSAFKSFHEEKFMEVFVPFNTSKKKIWGKSYEFLFWFSLISFDVSLMKSVYLFSFCVKTYVSPFKSI